MLESLNNMAKQAVNINNKMLKEVFDNKSLQGEIIDLNTQDQLYEQGIDAVGDSLGEYSTFTIQGTSNFKGKIEKGQRYDHITLNDTGEFYKSFKFRNENDGFTIEADTIKDDVDLEKKFSENIIGLTDENKTRVAKWIVEPLQGAIRKAFGK